MSKRYLWVVEIHTHDGWVATAETFGTREDGRRWLRTNCARLVAGRLVKYGPAGR